MFILIIMLLSTINSEPKGSNNYNIASYILKNIDALENESINQISEACFVSISSVSRFCKQIGLKDFNDLKVQLANYNNVRNSKFNFTGRDETDLLNSYINRVVYNIQTMQQSLSEINIDMLVKDIFNYQNVYAFGYLQSAYAALNLQGDIISSGKVIETSLRFTEQLAMLNQATEDDLIVVFSQSGQYFSRAFREENTNPARLTKAKIYMITMNEDIKKEDIVDEIIHYNCDNDYAAHPFPLDVIACLISLKYAKYCQAQENKAIISAF